MKSEENLICSICGKGPFQDRRGLLGHRSIVHGVEKRIVTDSEALKVLKEIERRLEPIDKMLETLDPLVEDVKQLDTHIVNELWHKVEEVQKGIEALKPAGQNKDIAQGVEGEMKGQEGKGGWVIVSVIVGLVLWNYFKEKGSEQQGSALPVKERSG